MLRQSLKRSFNDYKQLHSRLNDSVDTVATAYTSERPQRKLVNTYGGQEYRLLDEVLHPISGEQQKFKTKHVPSCLINTPIPLVEVQQPSCTSLSVEDQPLPAEVDKIIRNNSPVNPVRLGTAGTLCWLIQGSELVLWSVEVDDAVLLRHKFDRQVLVAAFGVLDGAISPSGSRLEVFAIAFDERISLYSYAKIGMLEELNINISTNNELVTWLAVRPEGIYYGGDEGTLKVVKSREHKWYSCDSEQFAWLKCPLLLGMFLDRTVEQVLFEATNKIVYALVERQYKDTWLNRKLFWKNGSSSEKEIQVYILKNNISLISRIREYQFITLLRNRYPSLVATPIEQLRIKNIFLIEGSSLGVCLAGGIFLEVANAITVEINRPLIYQNYLPSTKLYENTPGRICEDISGVQPQAVGARAGIVTNSLGLDNITIFSEPTQLSYISCDSKQMSVWLANKPGILDEEKEAGSIFVEMINQKNKHVSPCGQLVELEQLVAGSSLSSNFRKSVFAPMRKWLYLDDKAIKTVSKLRLLDLSLVLVRIHYEIASNDNLKTPHIMSLEESLRKFMATYGLVNFCECLLEIVLHRLLRVTVSEIDYHATLMASMGIPQNLQEQMPSLKGMKVIENSLEIKAFAEKLLLRISRQVRKPQHTPNIFYSNLMGKVQEDVDNTSADAMWHVLLKYFHALFEEVRNKPMSFFGSERRFCCFIREKMEMLRRFLVRKYSELDQFNLDEVSKPQFISRGFESMLNVSGRDSNPLPPSEETSRFGEESTKTLIYYMISALTKIQSLMEVFERFSLQGSTITIKLCLTNPKVAEQVRDIILNYYGINDPYVQALQNSIPQVLSLPDIIFHSWEQKTDAQQLRVDLRQAIGSLNLDQLNKIVTKLRTSENGLEKIADLLIHRLQKLDEELVIAGQQQGWTGRSYRDSITASVSNFEAEVKELRRQETLDCLKRLLRSTIVQIKSLNREEDLRGLAVLLQKFRKYVDAAQRAQQTRIRLEHERPITTSFGRVDSIIRNSLAQPENFLPGMQKLYESRQPESIHAPNAYDNFIGRSLAARRNNLL